MLDEAFGDDAESFLASAIPPSVNRAEAPGESV
jgi:hypothetical protein